MSDEEPEDHENEPSDRDSRPRRTIVRPRRQRKHRTDSLKENNIQDKDNAKSFPVPEQKTGSIVNLPWKKLEVEAPAEPRLMSLLMTTSTADPIAVPIKSIMNRDPDPDPDPDDQDESSSSTSEETSTSNEEPDNNNRDDEADSGSGSSGRFSVPSLSNMSPPIQDAQQHMDAPISWEPHGVNSKHEESRHFGILNSRSHMDRNHWSRSAAQESEYLETRSKIKSLQRQLSVVRRKIDDFETDFEDSHGYRPSAADKQNNKTVRKLIIQQTRLKRQIRLCRESGDSGILMDDSSSPVPSPASSNRSESPTYGIFANVGGDNNNFPGDDAQENNSSNRSPSLFQSVINDIEQKLQTDRASHGRPEVLDEMNPDQILEEKKSIQNALNRIQDVCGQPSTDDERAMLRGLYQR